jgi:dephospho-CoA kinase
MIVAGMTGGIASGKSTVAEMFARNGARIIDADRIARETVRKGTPAYADIVALFGDTILQKDGEIDRSRLAAIVFHDVTQRKALERIVHPRVQEETSRRLERIRREDPQAVVILDVPLLFESGMDRGLDQIIVVYVPAGVQIQRLMARDGYSEADALARIRSQMPIEEKKSLADMVIDNSGSLENTWAQTLEVYHQLAVGAEPNAEDIG